jgi:hypothetical protein
MKNADIGKHKKHDKNKGMHNMALELTAQGPVRADGNPWTKRVWLSESALQLSFTLGGQDIQKGDGDEKRKDGT